jgi:hypothetical protein
VACKELKIFLKEFLLERKSTIALEFQKKLFDNKIRFSLLPTTSASSNIVVFDEALYLNIIAELSSLPQPEAEESDTRIILYVHKTVVDSYLKGLRAR